MLNHVSVPRLCRQCTSQSALDISAPEIIGVEKSTWKRRFRKLIDEVPGVLGVSR